MTELDGRRRFLRAGLAACLVSALPGCRLGDRYVELGTVDLRLVPAGDWQRLVVRNEVGSVRIEGGAKRAIEVSARVFVKERRRRAVAGPLVPEEHVELVQEGTTVRVANRHRGAADHADWKLELHVRVPGAPAVAGEVAVGSVAVSLARLRGMDLLVRVGDCRLDIGRLEGPVKTLVQTGKLSFVLREGPLRSPISLHTQVGTLSCSLPPDADFSLDARTSVGRLEADTRGREVARKDSLTGAALSFPAQAEGAPRVVLRADVGSIDLR